MMGRSQEIPDLDRPNWHKHRAYPSILFISIGAIHVVVAIALCVGLHIS
jgi:hypothetical protein